jgi:hypothetical protein
MSYLRLVRGFHIVGLLCLLIVTLQRTAFSETEEQANALLQKLKPNPSTAPYIESWLTLLRTDPKVSKMSLSGPLLVQLTLELQKNDGSSPLATNTPLALQVDYFGEHPGFHNPARELHRALRTRQKLDDIDLTGDISGLNEPAPPFSIMLSKGADGEISASLGVGTEKILSGKRLTVAGLKAIRREFAASEPFNAINWKYNIRRFDGNTLSSLILAKLGGADVGNLPALAKVFPKLSRNEATLALAKSIRKVQDAQSLVTLMRSANLTEYSTRGVTRQIPAAIGREEVSLKSNMHTGEGGHLVVFDPNDPNWKTTTPPEGAKPGDVVQKNGVVNPFLKYQGRRLSEIPPEVWAAAKVSPDLSVFHRTRAASSAAAVASGHGFISLGGERSLIGGAASWGEGLYLSASPTLQDYYGPYLVMAKLHPDWVVGTNVDIFVGAQDEAIFVMKTGTGIEYSQVPDKKVLKPYLTVALEKGQWNNAIELLHQMPSLDADDLSKLAPYESKSVALRVYRTLRSHQVVSDPDKAALYKQSEAPNLSSPEEISALQLLASFDETKNDPTILETSKETAKRVPSPGPNVASLMGFVRRDLERLGKMIDLNAPDALTATSVRLAGERIDEIRHYLGAQVSREGHGARLAFCLSSLPVLADILSLKSVDGTIDYSSAPPPDNPEAKGLLARPILRAKLAEVVLEQLENLQTEIDHLQSIGDEKTFFNSLATKIFFSISPKADGQLTAESWDRLLTLVKGNPEFEGRLAKLAPTFAMAVRLDELRQRTPGKEPASLEVVLHGTSVPVVNRLTDFVRLAAAGRRGFYETKELEKLVDALPPNLRSVAARFFARGAPWAMATERTFEKLTRASVGRNPLPENLTSALRSLYEEHPNLGEGAACDAAYLLMDRPSAERK